MKTVLVKFNTGYDTNKKYQYLYDLEEQVAVNDYVIVDAPTTGLTVVQVKDVVDGYEPAATKYVVDIVDTSAYEARQARAKERARVQKELDIIFKQQEEYLKYAALASHSKEAAALIERLKELQK